MATVKLTKAMRDEICDAMLKMRFQSELEALSAEWELLAQQVYGRMLSLEDLRLMASLPEGWLRADTSFLVKLGDVVVRLYLDGRFYSGKRLPAWFTHKTTDHHWRMPYSWGSRVVQAFETGHLITQRYEKIVHKTEEKLDEIRYAREHVMAALNQATTLARLKVLWPEAAPFCAPFESVDRQLPMVPVKTLNELLELP